MRCSRSLKYQRPCQSLDSSSTGNQQHIQRSQRDTKPSIHSPAEICQGSTPPNGHLHVTAISSNVSSLRSAGGTACSPGKYISSCSNYMVMMLSLTRRCAFGASGSAWIGSTDSHQRLSRRQWPFILNCYLSIISQAMASCSGLIWPTIIMYQR
jgi:hypothetical protein